MHWRGALAALVLCAGLLAAKSASTDGEATIYIFGDFSKGFALSYAATMRPQPANRGVSFLSIDLLSTGMPFRGVAVGLSLGDPKATSLKAFTTSTTAHGSDYTPFTVDCAPACTLQLRSDGQTIYAFAGTQKLGSWPRSKFGFVKPYVQINGEVVKPHDAITASLAPIQLVANGQTIPPPQCAFTTQGVFPLRQPDGTLTFTGTFTLGADVTYLDARTGARVNTCKAFSKR